MTAPSQIFAGGRILAAAVRGVAPLSAYKSIDEAVTSSTTLQNDDALLLSLQANAVYYFTLVLGYKGAASGTGDIKFGWAFPSGAVMAYALYGNNAGVATNGFWETQTSVPALNSLGTSTPVGAVAQGTIAVSSTPGTLQLQWAQHTSSATATTVLTGSVLLAWQVQ